MTGWRWIDMTGNDNRKISSLRDLPREIAPPRDLWKGIEAQITADRQAVARISARDSSRMVRLRVLAAAAVVAALGLGVWIGQWMYRPVYVANGKVLTA